VVAAADSTAVVVGSAAVATVVAAADTGKSSYGTTETAGLGQPFPFCALPCPTWLR
jgi:hypothetical protein